MNTLIKNCVFYANLWKIHANKFCPFLEKKIYIYI